MVKVSNIRTDDAPTPSQQIVAKANAGVTFTDKKGRSITLRQIRGALRMRFIRLVGGDGVENSAYVAYATLAACIASVDGEAVSFPTTQLQLDAIVERFDDGLLEEVGTHYRDAFMSDSENSVEDDAKN
jgi:hypothetical protein